MSQQRESRLTRTLFGLVCFVAGVLLAAAAGSMAEGYVSVGLGKGELRHPGYNKWWIQEGWDYRIDEKSSVWHVGVGWKFNRYLAVEINHHDLGEYHHFAGFMVNESAYNASSPTLCNGTCEPTQWGYLTGSATAISASILPSLPITDRLSVYARLGLARVNATFTAHVTPLSNTSKGFSNLDIFSERITTPFYGFGIQYGRVAIEVQEFPYVTAEREGCCSAYTSAGTVTISYRWTIK